MTYYHRDLVIGQSALVYLDAEEIGPVVLPDDCLHRYPCPGNTRTRWASPTASYGLFAPCCGPKY